MALNQLQIQVIAAAFNQCRLLTDTLLPQLERTDILCNGAAKVLLPVTQADIDQSGVFSGTTLQQLNDIIFALTGTVRTAVVNAKAALEIGSARQ